MAIQQIDRTTPKPGGKVGDDLDTITIKINGNNLSFLAEIENLQAAARTFIEQLKGAAIVEGNAFVFMNNDNVEVSLDIRSEVGSVPVLHYNRKFLTNNGLPVIENLVGGAGSRPWTGSGWSDHSTAAYHLIASETHTPTAQGTDFSIVATPIGSAQTGRVHVARFNGDGDVICSRGQTTRMINPTERGRGVEVFREGMTAQISMASNQPGLSSILRAYCYNGTLANPSATQPNFATGFAMCGHDGSSFVGAKALITLGASGAWSTTNTPADITFSTTAPNTTSRLDRWKINQDGHIIPVADNSKDLGAPGLRVRQIYSNNSSISTSDAREKTAPRDMSQQELMAFSEIGRLPNVWQWLHRVGSDSVRLHAGPTVQACIAIMESHELDWRSYACFCFDEWDKTEDVIGEDGVVTAKGQPAGNRYGLRKDELLMMVTRSLFAEMDTMNARLAALEI